MKVPDATHRKAREFFDNLWKQDDPWDLETSDYEQAKYGRQLDLIRDRRYERALEVGCGAGRFTRSLAVLADRVLGIDVAPAAIERARSLDLIDVEFQVADIMEIDIRQGGPWDLIVIAETIYYLGWLYPFFDIGWLAAQLFEATREGGRCLMTNVFGLPKEYLVEPWLIETYRDLFLNVGYRLESGETFAGAKDGVEITASICLFRKELSG